MAYVTIAGRKRARMLAWASLGVSIAMTAGSFVVIALTSTRTDYQSLWGDMLIWGAVLAFSVVGALVAARHPDNRIGWLLCASGLLWAAKGLANEYAVYALLGRHEQLTGATLAAWCDTWLGIIAQLLLVVYLPLWFPTGRVAGPRWLIVERVAAVAIAVTVFGFMIKPGPLGSNDEYAMVDNPLGISHPPQLDDLLVLPSLTIVAACAAAAIVSLGLRLRAARGVERQQIKWVAYWLAISLVGFILNALAHVFWPSLIVAALLIFIATIVAIPLVIGISILRYHLFDIDRLINRTLVYGALTVLLGAFYVAGVVIMGAALDTVTRGSNLAVATTTLLVAALARPARNRVQHFVDQRFYRRNYDASRAIAGFSSRLRDEIDLDALSGELCRLVQETMQPASVTLWLRGDDGGHQPLPI